MSNREVMQQALEALERADKDDFWREQRDAITALKAALEQQQAEPVAWPQLSDDMEYAAQDEFHILPPRMKRLWKRMQELYTAPPQQQAEPVHGDMAEQLADALDSAQFYRRRVKALQSWQSKMRDPERTIVCDIIANGVTLDPAGDRYTAALEQQQAEPVHGDIRALKYRIHELEGEVMGYKRMLDVAEAASQPQQQAEPVSHAVIAGALFDFMGWLTTRKERLVLSSTDNATPAADAVTDFAEMRGLSLNDAKVQDWQDYTTPPQQQPEPPSEWPLIKNILDEYGLQAISFVAEWKAAQQQTEPVAWMDREGDLYKMPEITNWAPPHTMLYTTPPQRQWVGLTDEDFLEACQIAERGNYLLAFQRIQIKLKERNNG